MAKDLSVCFEKFRNLKELELFIFCSYLLGLKRRISNEMFLMLMLMRISYNGNFLSYKCRRNNWPVFIMVLHFLQENDLIDEKHKNFLLQSYLKVLTKKKDSKDLKNIFKLVKKSSKDKINKLFDEKEIKFLFKENVDMKVESEVEKEKENEETILIYTIKEGYPVTALESLNNNKENINSRDNYGKTALMYASEKGYEELVTKLLEKKGINLDLKDKDGYTALDYAKNKEIRELLIEKGAKNGVRIK